MKCGSKGFSLIELLIAVSIILAIAAIAIPNLLRSRIQANEAAAVMSMRSIDTAETMYQISYPQFGFANSLSKLGPPAGGAPVGPDAADLLGSGLGCPTEPCAKAGYAFTLATNGTPASLYYLTATPVVAGSTGTKIFRSSNDLKIAFDPITPETIQDKH